MKLCDIDPNFRADNTTDRPDIVWHNVKEAPFALYGLYRPQEEDSFRRMPPQVARAASPGVCWLNENTAGGRVRFGTDSPYIAILCELERPVEARPHITRIASQGFDLYASAGGETEHYVASFMPPLTNEMKYVAIRDIPTPGIRYYTLNFPLYGTVKNLYVGLAEGASLLPGLPYRNRKPAVFYGSSITQGGCASRPGTCYQAFLSREWNMDYVNLGFAGAAKAEPAMIDYLSSLDMSIFVCDYDYNSPTPEHLRRTLPLLYQAVRRAHPTLPIVFASSPGGTFGMERHDIVADVYQAAKKGGDEFVRFADGMQMFGTAALDCTVDGCHPTDLGFYLMYLAFAAQIKDFLPGME